MITFLIGLCILIVGGLLYGKLCEKVMRPSDKKTPAEEKYDGVDYVPIKKWKNSLIELLNIAGTGPILGPIQGILFGPIVFITIPIGCVLGGALHDYMCGMISVRNGGMQMPALIRKYIGKKTYILFNIFVTILMLLVGVVFIYTPGDLFVSQIMGQETTLSNPLVIGVYGVIFLYYIIATLLPIDKIIGRVYPVFGAVLLLSAVGVFAGLFIKGYPLDELWDKGFSFKNMYGDHFIPIFFVTVACGIVSGFHSTQATIISRTLKSEKHGRMTFYNMMILEGFIAMVWAAAAMGAVNGGLTSSETLHIMPTDVVGIVAKDMLGTVGGFIAITGVIVLPITSGDTALRSIRIMICDALGIDTANKKKSLSVAIVIFAIVAGVLIYAKNDAQGFNALWKYFSWANEVIAVFAFAMISVYMINHRRPYFMALLPGMFYMYVIASYILSAKIGFGFDNTLSYLIAGFETLLYAILISSYGNRESALKGFIVRKDTPEKPD